MSAIEQNAPPCVLLAADSNYSTPGRERPSEEVEAEIDCDGGAQVRQLWKKAPQEGCSERERSLKLSTTQEHGRRVIEDKVTRARLERNRPSEAPVGVVELRAARKGQIHSTNAKRDVRQREAALRPAGVDARHANPRATVSREAVVGLARVRRARLLRDELIPGGEHARCVEPVLHPLQDLGQRQLHAEARALRVQAAVRGPQEDAQREVAHELRERAVVQKKG